MHFDRWTFLLQTINFLVFVWVLKRFLFKPVMAAVARRQSEATRLLDEATAAKQRAGEEAHAFEARREEVAHEREGLLDEARMKARGERDRVIATATREAEAMLAATREQLVRERQTAAESMCRAATEVALELAQRLLREAGSTLDPEPFLNRIDALLGEATPDEMRNLREQIDGKVTLATSPPLDESRKSVWQSRLSQRLGRDVRLEFVADPSLLAGAELRLPRSVVGASLRDALVHAREELDAVGAAR